MEKKYITNAEKNSTKRVSIKQMQKQEYKGAQKSVWNKNETNKLV